MYVTIHPLMWYLWPTRHDCYGDVSWSFLCVTVSGR
jgi:hypothetical protein